MNCVHCSGEHTSKFGKDRSGTQRFRCADCRRTFLEPTVKPLGDMRIDLNKAVFALGLLLEGMSIRATERMTGINRDTLCDLVIEVGTKCRKFMERSIYKVPTTNVECDEQWSFVFCKQKTAERLGHADDVGDSYVFTAMDRDTKLLLCHHVGKRTSDDTWAFVEKLYLCVAGRPTISTDGYTPYTQAIPLTFRHAVDYAQVIKTFATPGKEDQRKYSPASITKIERKAICGEPDKREAGTSRMERFNLSTRMHVRRFTRLTNGHSKSLAHHEAMIGLYFAWYNWSRKHLAIKTTPAVAAKLATEPWTLERLLTEAAKPVAV